LNKQATKGSGMKWVGRAIRRLEDPALVTGHGRFTADLPATHWVRFVRSPVAAGKIARLEAPPGATVITAADLRGVKPILPMLHKFNYRPVPQQVLADGEVRFVGEAVAAVVAASEEEAEDIVDAVELTIDETTPVVDAAAVPYLTGAREALADGFVSGGTRRNLDWVRPHTDLSAVSEDQALLLADAQTSGGLLLGGEVPGAPVIGEFVPRGEHVVVVR